MQKQSAISTKLKTNKAFTLAEVLITLGIIGVVAAITIPALMNNTNQAELKTAYKKAFSVANQAYKMGMINNGGAFTPYVTGSTTDAVTKFNGIKSNLKVIQDCPFGSGARGKCWAAAGVGPAGYAVSSCSQTSNSAPQNNNASFVSADGMFWMLYSYSVTNGGEVILVDVNGEKGPNDWGKDVFILKLNDINISPHTGCANLQHNDGSAVDTAAEFSAPLLN